MNLTGKRFVGSFSSDAEQYKKLLANAVAFAKDNQVAIGVEPNAEQLENLKEPIVWLEEKSVVLPDGRIVKALVPRVYLPVTATDNYGTLGSAVIGAENIDVDVTNNLLNQGTIVAGNKNDIAANNINNYGGTIKGSDVILNAMNDVNNEGGTFAADKKMEIKAGRDIHMETTTGYAENNTGSRTSINQVAGTYVTGDKGSLTMEAGRNVNLKAADIVVSGEESEATIKAGKYINLDTVKAGSSNDIVFDRDNYRHDKSLSDVGTSLQTEGSLALEVGRDMNATAAHVKAGKDLSVKASEDINIKAGESDISVTEHHKYTNRGTFSSTTKVTHSESDEHHASGSTLSGDKVKLEAGKDTNVTGSNVVGSKDVNIKAGKDVNITAADEQLDYTDIRKEKTSGIMGSGFGITIGTAITKTKHDRQNHMKAGSTVGNVEGSVNIEAGNKARVEASDIVACKDINISAKEVHITSANEQYDSQYKYEHKITGLTVSVGGGIIDRAQKVASSIEKAHEANDERLSALHGVKAVQDAQNIVREKLQSHIGISGSSPDGRTDGQKAADKANAENKAFNVKIGWGSSKASQSSSSISKIAKGSNVLAGGDVSIKATEKDIDVHGSNVSGENVNLDAAGKVNITAGENTNKTDTDNKSSSAGFGVSISTTGGVGAYVSASTAKEKIKENSTTHTPSTATAKDKLTIKSGKDTNITGSKVGGEKVEADIDGNLNVESLQEKQAYEEKSSGAGISISGIGLGAPNISGSAGAGKMQSDHSTVTDQAGIYAGKKGFDIKVKGNTDLKGAVIDSKASADKNKLETGTISFEDIENKAEYDTSGIGISYDGAASKDENAKLGDKGLIPNIPIGSSDKTYSTTQSGVAPGTITIKDKDKQKQDIRYLNRDTTNTLNKLDQIFDKDTIQEKQEMAAIFGELAYNQIHDISKRAGWKDTDPRKATLHAIVGGIMAKLGDGNFLAGASGAAVNEMMQKELSKIKDPALHQWASAAVGAAVGSIVGGKTGAQSGASTAAMGTKENALSENEYQAMLDKITKNHHASYEEAIFMSEARDKQWIEDNKDELPLYSNDGVNVYEPHYVGYDPKTGGKQYLSADGKKIVLKKYYGLEQFKTRIDNLDFSNVSEGAFKIMNDEIEYHGVKLQIGVIVYRHNNKNYIYQTAGMFGTDGIFPMIGTSDTTGYMYDYTGKKITGLELVEKLEGKAIVFSGSIGGIGGDVSYGGTNSIIIAGGLSTNPGVSAGVSISERVYL